MAEVFTTSAPPTALMAETGLTFVDVAEVAQGVVHLLETQGATAISAVKNIMLMVKKLTDRDMVGVFVALNAAVQDVTAIIAAVRSEFGI